MSPAEMARRVALGYGRVLRSAGKTLLIFLGMAAVALGVSYPVWWLAMNRRGLYTALVAGGCLAAAAVLIVRRAGIGRAVNRSPGGKSLSGRILARSVFAAATYGVAVLFSRSAVLGILAAAALAALAGIWVFGRVDPVERQR